MTLTSLLNFDTIGRAVESLATIGSEVDSDASTLRDTATVLFVTANCAAPGDRHTKNFGVGIYSSQVICPVTFTTAGALQTIPRRSPPATTISSSGPKTRSIPDCGWIL